MSTELSRPCGASSIAALSAWQSIETAPHDGSDVLVYGRGSYAVAHWDGREWRDIGDIGWSGMSGDDGNQPTHWIPLPAPPTPALPEISEAPRLL